MGQIVKRKKKGRPSKADLARRAAAAGQPDTAAEEMDVRRSRRRRNVRYTFDFDDYIEDDEYDDDGEEDAWRREKKLKQLLKLQSEDGGGSAESAPSRTRRVAHATASASSSDSGNGGNPLKKRKIGGEDAADDEDGNDVDDDEEEVRGRQTELKGADSVPGTPSDPPLGFPLPDKKSLELILDKLQKKDIYGVYAEPVDPEELPDYHEVIEHPMDFSTVRKKLGNGSYSTLEQFESDVFLICKNAMLYNAPDTIYHKQARSIQELAQKKFQRLRIDAERTEKELTSEHLTRPDLAKKQIKKPMSRTTQEPVGSDFSSGATLATARDFQRGPNATQAGGLERLSNVDGPVGGITSLNDNNLEKTEDLSSGKGLLSRLGRKPSMSDENRRATYNISNQPVSRTESIFTTFDGEIKQLVAVGLPADHSYARSLARFAATLGPVAWNVASKRIEQALPPGFKFGRGWIGDYEPLPTPVLMLDNCSPKDPALLMNLHDASNVKKDEKTSKAISVSALEHPVNVPTLKGNSSLFGASVTKTTVSPTASAPVPVIEQSIRGAGLEGKQPFFRSGGSRATSNQSVIGTDLEGKQPSFRSGGSRATSTANANYQQQNPRPRNIEPAKKVIKQVESNCSPPSANKNIRDFVAEKQIPNGDVPPSQFMETVPRNRNLLQSEPLKQPENNGFAAGGSLKGKVSTNSLNRKRIITSPSEDVPNQMATAATNFSHGQEQGLSDPVQLMRMLAENSQKQQKSVNHSPVDNTPVVQSVPSSRNDDSSNAAAAAARAWMSIGSGGSKAGAENTSTHNNQISAGSLYNPTREFQPQVSQFRGDFPGFGMHFQPAQNSFPLHAFMVPPGKMGVEAQLQNRPMFFPQFVTADLSRFQVQSPPQGLNPLRPPRQKQESVPPDLNIGFQSSGSPVRQSSGVLVDSQQPDLALQL